MTSFFKKYQSVITIIVVVGIAFIAYSIFFKPQSDQLLALKVEGSEERSPIEEELVVLLLQLRSITLDTALLADPLFQSLQDFGQTIVPEATGRENPFEPFSDN